MKKQFLVFVLTLLSIVASAAPVDNNGIWYNLNTMNNDKPRTVVISGVRIRNLAIDRTVLLLRVLLPALSICIPLKPFAIYDYIVRQMISSSDKLIIPSDFLSEAQNN